jgi:glutathione S-transferase
MSEKPQLDGPKYSTYTRTVRLALAEKQVDYDLNEVDFLRGAAATPEHRSRHPFGKVPVLVDGEFSVYETGAILSYIQDAFDGPSLMPSEPQKRASVNQMSSVINAYVYPPVVGTIVIQRFIMPILGRDCDVVRTEKAVGSARNALNVVNNNMGESTFLAGETITAADLYLVPMYDFFEMTPEGSSLLPEFANLARWWTDMKDRPSVVNTRASID